MSPEHVRLELGLRNSWDYRSGRGPEVEVSKKGREGGVRIRSAFPELRLCPDSGFYDGCPGRLRLSLDLQREPDGQAAFPAAARTPRPCRDPLRRHPRPVTGPKSGPPLDRPDGRERHPWTGPPHARNTASMSGKYPPHSVVHGPPTPTRGDRGGQELLYSLTRTREAGRKPKLSPGYELTTPSWRTPE